MQAIHDFGPSAQGSGVRIHDDGRRHGTRWRSTKSLAVCLPPANTSRYERDVAVNEAERAAILASARAYLEWEVELSGFGLPELELAQEIAHLSPLETHASAANAPASAAPQQHLARPLPERTAVSAHGASSMSGAPDDGQGRSGGRGGPTPPDVSTRTVDRATAARAGLAALAEATPGATVVSASERRVRLAQLEQEVQQCARCELAKTRSHTVFARGSADAPLVFIGEGPGQEEDKEGLPFVGPAGKLLDRMIAAMGFARDDVYICNVVKCRPPGNRTPLPSEAGACASYLLGQLDAVRPQVIVALGRCATENLGLVQGGGWRGRWGKFRGIDVMPTYHPAFLLRSPEFKRPVWEDLQKVMSRLKQSG